jgi:glycosyltransferase involved in cell wall biosynthesis
VRFAVSELTMKICILSSFEDSMQKDTGPSVRIYNLAKGVAALGNEVRVVMPKETNISDCIEGVEVYGFRGLYPKIVLKALKKLVGVARSTSLYFYDLLFISRVSRLIRESDVVQIEQQTAGGLLIPFIKIVLKRPVVVDCHDVFQALRVKHTNAMRKFIETFLERLAYRYGDMVLTVSEKEKEYLVSCGVRKHNIRVIPNGVDTEIFNGSSESSGIRNRYGLKGFRTVIFVGNMEYFPNWEAVQLIASEIAPRVLREIKKTKFLIVGRTLKKIDSSNLFFTDVVDNVAVLLGVSDVAIAPLLHGSGTRLKILEYFSCGLPVVSTTVGAEGLDVTDGVHILIADGVDLFASRVVDLLKDNALSKKLGKAARDLVVDKYDWMKVAKKLAILYLGFLAKNRRVQMKIPTVS